MTTMTGRPVPEDALAQRILNEHDPAGSRVFEQGVVAVNARVVWEHDGEQLLPATALRWSERAVYVGWLDPGNPVGGAWLWPRDVREM